MNDKNEIEEIEIKLLLEGVFQKYGYDFREYAPASLKRRIWKCISDEKLNTISGLQEKILHDPSCMERFLFTVTIDVTEFFRDSNMYITFRERLVPILRDYPFIRIWHAGCSTGEEVYSIAILLMEEELYNKTQIYATDMNEKSLKKAKEGIYPLKAMKGYTSNYLEAGGRKSFSGYYIAKYENAIFQPSLQKNIVWAQHNLVTDSSFNEFNVILCRNVMIYFNKSLQERVHNLLYDSLALSGILCLGSKESIKFTSHETDYEVFDENEKIYRRIR